MAEAFAKKYGADKVIASSAGNKPSDKVNPVVVEVLKEKGIDISKNKPKLLTYQMAQDADLNRHNGLQRPRYLPRSVLQTNR